MLKFEHIQPGERIRAYEFEPFPGSDLYYIEGEVVGHFVDKLGTKFLEVACESDSVYDDGHPACRIDKTVYVPMEVTFSEFDSRVEVLS